MIEKTISAVISELTSDLERATNDYCSMHIYAKGVKTIIAEVERLQAENARLKTVVVCDCNEGETCDPCYEVRKEFSE